MKVGQSLKKKKLSLGIWLSPLKCRSEGVVPDGFDHLPGEPFTKHSILRQRAVPLQLLTIR